MSFLRRFSRLCLFTSTLLGLSCVDLNSVVVAETTWKVDVSGVFSEAGNWSNGVPTVDSAGIISGGTQTITGVTLQGAVTLNVNGGTTTFSGPTTVGDGTNAALLKVATGAKFGIIGGGLTIKAGSTAEMALASNAKYINSEAYTGNIDGRYFVIGASSDSASNFLTVEKGATLKLTEGDGRVHVGYNAGSSGTVNVYGTMNTSINYFCVGTSGTGSINIDGGTLTTKNIILGDVENKGKGYITITNGGRLESSTYLKIGQKAGTVGEVIVDNGTIITKNEILVGDSGKGKLEITNGSTVTTSGNFMLGNNDSSTGSSFLIEDSTLTVGGEHLILGRSSDSDVIMRGDNAVINFNGWGVCGLSEFGSGVVFTMEGGSFNVNKNPGSYGGFTLDKDSILNQSGGTMNIGTETVTTNLKVRQSGTYNLSGGTINVTGNLEKESGATFNMTGGTLSANNVKFHLDQKGGNLSPGIDWGDDSAYHIGTTTLDGYTLGKDATLTLELDLENGVYDQIAVNGEFLFREGAKVDLLYDSLELAPNMSYNLIQAETFSDESFKNLEIALSSYSSDWVIMNNAGTINFAVNPAAVPEPATWVLLLLGVSIFILRRHKK
ncbi:MAG: PEP-CTERM sorting domain-containing protein [Planctomycetia bacterium]|nr:PEP-CTERM sorting domain-containing protein [Planctomycetia bacterium]